ncbi:MAG: hypothetical protein ABEJ55_07030 [Halanaeroarchaeum sp.]
MTASESDGLIQNLWRSTTFWISIGVGAVTMTTFVYARYGFVQSFAPFLVVILAIRRLFYLHFREEPEASSFSESFGVDPDTEYTEAEQIDVLTDVRSHYSSKRTTWGILAVLSVLVTLYAAVVSPLLAIVVAIVAVYGLVRTYRTHQAVQLAERRLDQLEESV